MKKLKRFTGLCKKRSHERGCNANARRCCIACAHIVTGLLEVLVFDERKEKAYTVQGLATQAQVLMDGINAASTLHFYFLPITAFLPFNINVLLPSTSANKCSTLSSDVTAINASLRNHCGSRMLCLREHVLVLASMGFSTESPTGLRGCEREETWQIQPLSAHGRSRKMAGLKRCNKEVKHVRLVNAIDEEENSGEALDIVLMRRFDLNGGVDLGQNNVVELELGSGSGLLGRKGLAVATPGGVELDHDEAVLLDDGGEIALLQNDDVLVVHRGLLERLLGGGVEAEEIDKVWSGSEKWARCKVAVTSSGSSRKLRSSSSALSFSLFLLSFGESLSEREGDGGEEKKTILCDAQHCQTREPLSYKDIEHRFRLVYLCVERHLPTVSLALSAKVLAVERHTYRELLVVLALSATAIKADTEHQGSTIERPLETVWGCWEALTLLLGSSNFINDDFAPFGLRKMSHELEMEMRRGGQLEHGAAAKNLGKSYAPFYGYPDTLMVTHSQVEKGEECGNHPVESKLKLDHQNQNASLPLNVDSMVLCEEGKHDRVMELMGQDATADYRVYLVLLNLCDHTRSFELRKRIHELMRRSTFRGDGELSNRLIGMYNKCGSVKDAR
ncbi:hypothetical protein V8G54_027399 [Vigna mungo]|uniref:Uncharacterized protein n=1 Tax=Vigna mungo TaxID=3915 RepID=A0AAQ3N2E1_VIGMU